MRASQSLPCSHWMLQQRPPNTSEPVADSAAAQSRHQRAPQPTKAQECAIDPYNGEGTGELNPAAPWLRSKRNREHTEQEPQPRQGPAPTPKAPQSQTQAQTTRDPRRCPDNRAPQPPPPPEASQDQPRPAHPLQTRAECPSAEVDMCSGHVSRAAHALDRGEGWARGQGTSNCEQQWKYWGALVCPTTKHTHPRRRRTQPPSAPAEAILYIIWYIF